MLGGGGVIAVLGRPPHFYLGGSHPVQAKIKTKSCPHPPSWSGFWILDLVLLFPNILFQRNQKLIVG